MLPTPYYFVLLSSNVILLIFLIILIRALGSTDKKGPKIGSIFDMSQGPVISKGTQIRPADLRKGRTLHVIISTTCQVCKTVLNTIQRNYEDKMDEIELIVVGEEEITEWYTQHEHILPMRMMSLEEMRTTYNVDIFPYLIITDAGVVKSKMPFTMMGLEENLENAQVDNA